jgi:hypothetical protein
MDPVAEITHVLDPKVFEIGSLLRRNRAAQESSELAVDHFVPPPVYYPHLNEHRLGRGLLRRAADESLFTLHSSAKAL